VISFSEGQEIELKGVIVQFRIFSGERKYYLKNADATFTFRTRDSFNPGDVISLNGVVENISDFSIIPKKINLLSGKEVYSEIEAGIMEKTEIKLSNALPALKEPMEKVAKKLIAAKELNRYIMLRFHGDADGIAGALVLRKILRFRGYQQNSAVYSPREAVNDIGTLNHENRPILILLDFGANTESIDGLKLLNAAGIETIIIDHHPFDKKVKEYSKTVLTPWDVDGLEDPSKYTAGYLSAEIANMCGAENASDYAKIACAGDKSNVAEPGEKDRKTALVLDYLAAHAAFGNSLDFYADVLKKEELYSSIYSQASEKISEALERALPKIKKIEKNGITVYVIPLDGVVEPKVFPNRSKVTTAVFEHFRTDSPMVAIGFGKRTVIMRANDAFIKRGLSFPDIIKKVSSDMKDFVMAGGGHAKAAAVRVEEGYEKSVVDRLIEEFK